jgi:hypothetical protein
MKSFLVAVSTLAVFGLQHANADLITSLYNTGVDGSGNILNTNPQPIFDSHYTLVSAPAGQQTGPASAELWDSSNGFPVGPWLADDALSTWIVPYPHTNDGSGYISNAVGLYDFQTSCDLTGFDPSTASIVGRWSTDNQGLSIYLNGTQVVGSNIGQFAQWTNFVIPASALFNAGVNTLDFVVNNDSGGFGNPAGLRVELTGNAVAAVPEASTFAIWSLLGVVGLSVGSRRRSRTR